MNIVERIKQLKAGVSLIEAGKWDLGTPLFSARYAYSYNDAYTSTIDFDFWVAKTQVEQVSLMKSKIEELEKLS